MGIRHERADERGVAVLVLHDTLDGAAAEELNNLLHSLIAAPGSRLVVDLQGVTYVSSAGLGSLLAASRSARRMGSKFFLCGAREGTAEAIKVLGIADLLSLQPDRPTALTAASA